MARTTGLNGATVFCIADVTGTFSRCRSNVSVCIVSGITFRAAYSCSSCALCCTRFSLLSVSSISVHISIITLSNSRNYLRISVMAFCTTIIFAIDTSATCSITGLSSIVIGRSTVIEALNSPTVVPASVVCIGSLTGYAVETFNTSLSYGIAGLTCSVTRYCVEKVSSIRYTCRRSCIRV